jgi:ribose transport system ATP-binding protein
MHGSTAVDITSVSKTFAGQRALDCVSASLQAGQVTALLGMNGSGKSTLIKILAGVYAPDAGGGLRVFGDEVPLPSTPAAAHARGLRFLHQDLGLVPELTVADNFAFVGRFPTRGPARAIDARRLRSRVAGTLEFLGVAVEPDQRVEELNPATRTMVGIARALDEAGGVTEATVRRRILVLDEPTASLPADQVQHVLAVVEHVRSLGGTVVYVSHRTDEVLRVADRMLILRDGRLVVDEPVGAHTAQQLVTRIVGREVVAAAPRAERAVADAGRPVLEAVGLIGRRLRGVDLTVGAGEIVGLAGLVGCGRSELVRILGGAQVPAAGTMRLQRSPFAPSSPRRALARGVATVPQDRRADGCVLPLSVADNLSLGSLAPFVGRTGVIDTTAERQRATTLVADHAIKVATIDAPIESLSGGNQQKVVVARAADRASAVLLLDEPTQGVDAIAKQEIAHLVRRRAATGVAVVVASSDNQELVDLCDRVLILDRGAVVGELSGSGLDEDTLTYLCAHASERTPHPAPTEEP